MINVDDIDRTVHRFQPEPLNSVKTATIQVFLVDRQERLADREGFEPQVTRFSKLVMARGFLV